MLIHENFMHTFPLHDKRLNVGEDDVSMAFLPLSHVFERTWSYYMLHCGAVNTILENPREVMENLLIAKPTLMCTVPRFFEKTYEGIETEVAKWSSLKQNIFKWAIKVGHQYSDYRSQSKSVPVTLKLNRLMADRLVFRKLRAIFGGNIRSMPCSGAAIRPELLKFFHATGLNVLYGYGATETTATVSCFKADNYDFTTVGTVLPGVEVRIGDEGEIQVKGKTVFKGYYKKPVETAEVLKDGWYGTGDEGSLSADANLVMTDRIKDLFKTSLGKYISPQKVELLLAQDQYIEQVIVIGDNRKYVTALIVPVGEQLKAYAEKLGLGNLHQDILLTRQEIIDHMKERIDKLQAELTGYEKVVKFTLLKEPFSIENMTMTSTLKLRRRFIMDYYREVIDKMY
jgi:long-chain acyl-CoA synthetase